MPNVRLEAKIRTSRYSLIWLVPLVAAAVAIYLGWKTLASRGPLITLTFADGTGLVAKETKLQDKAVAIGTVEHVALSDHFSRVTASVRVSKDAAPLMTDHARFWVVRPRFSLTNPSGLQTLISGSYIAIDPGPPGGEPKDHFEGLNQPPGVRSDEPGQMFTLRARRLGGLSVGAPVLYRDIPVGRLIDHSEPGAEGQITMHVFIKAPYDRDVRTETHFWNSSGLSMNVGRQGFHVAVDSLEALVAGGISFANFGAAESAPPGQSNTVYELFADFNEAENAGFHDNIHCVSYFDASTSGLERGSGVELYGIRIGTVTGTQLQLDPETSRPRVRVIFDIQPERVSPPNAPRVDPLKISQQLVDLGMRARVDTANLLTGQQMIGLDMVPDASPTRVAVESERIVWPSSSGGGFQSLTASVDAVMAKLQRLPLDRLGTNANDLLNSLRELSDTAKDDLKPLTTQLAQLEAAFQKTLREADRLLASVQAGYGANSEMRASVQDLVAQATRSVRSIQELANFLERHPGSVVWGR